MIAKDSHTGGDVAVAWDDAVVHLHPEDNVAIAKQALAAGLILEGGTGSLTVRRPIPAGQKLALRSIAPDEAVRRYGQVIGFAHAGIQPGDHVHVHNVGVGEFDRDPAFGVDACPVAPAPEGQRRAFLGFRRPSGRAGTRNYVAILSTVNCSAHAAREIARHFTPERLAPYPRVDGVIALTHPYGCPVDSPTLQRTLAGMAGHPNVGAGLLVGLGCESNQVSSLVQRYRLEGPALRTLVIQERGGLGPTIAAGIAAVEELLPAVDAAERMPVPLSELAIALQCGGSDAWSGVTANPVVGLLVDELIRQGGTAVLAETPEIYGAEHLLTRRAVSPEVGRRLLDLVAGWREYAARSGFALDDNRSPGNEAGGLTTIYEKSLGAVAKAGSTPLTAVYEYAQAVTARGFTFMNAPGYDPVAVTGQVAGGCNLVLFTTGRGSVFGFKPAPSIKVSSTSELYRRMAGDIDLDAGRVLAGASLEGVAGELLDLIIAVASGRPTKSEAQGAGEAEFCPWNVEGTL